MKPRPKPSVISRRQFVGTVAGTSAALLLPRMSRAADAGGPPKKLGVALLGLGNYSEYQLAPALRRTRHCRLTGAVTGDRAKGLAWAREYGFSEKNVFTYDTMADLAGNADIDVVYVVTPNGLHAEHTIAAAKAGKHVICEKPMAVSVAECDAMIAACRAAAVRLMIGYRLHYEPHHVEFARLGRENVFGPFLRMRGANGFRMDGSERAATTWRVNKKLAGGGPLMDMGVYVIQAACMAKGEAAPVSVTAAFDRATRPETFTEVEESVRWIMEFADGAKARCHATYAESVSWFRAEADKGWAELNEPAFYYEDPVLTTSAKGRVSLPNVNQQAAQMDGMAEEILTGRPSLAPGEMGRRDMAIVEAIYDAAGSGKRAMVKGA